MTTTNGGSQGRIVEHVDGQVAAANERGVHLDGESAWRNYSKFASALPTPAQGQHVRLGLDAAGFVRELQVLDASPGATTAAPCVLDDLSIRLRVLEIAATTVGQFAQTHEAASTDHILPLAERLLAWVTREAPSDA
jgi:hypothetical protein